MSKKYKKRTVEERDRGEEKELGKGDSKNRTAKKKKTEPISLDEPKVGQAKRIQRFALTQN